MTDCIEIYVGMEPIRQMVLFATLAKPKKYGIIP
jgi:hypothetical protein